MSRDKIHDYDDVNLNLVWQTAQNDLPPLIAKLEAHLAKMPPDQRARRNCTNAGVGTGESPMIGERLLMRVQLRRRVDIA